MVAFRDELVSVLNTMLRDLERRGARPMQALPTLQAPSGEAAAPAPGQPRSGRLRGLVVLLLAAGAAAAAFWLWPRPIASPARALPAASMAAAPALATPPSEPVAPVAAATPHLEPAPVQPMHPHPETSTLSASSAKAPKPKSDASPTTRSEVPVRSATVSPSSAQSDLTRATDLIARGRSTEAAQVLASALVNRPTWHEARFTLAALQAERDERRQALTTLLEGAALDPGRFALTAAQLQAELNDPVGALRTLEQVPQAARDEEFHALVAAIAQRAGRHELAVTEYGTVLKSAPARAVAWVGLGVSLQALGREAQALAAYRGAAQGALGVELRRFVDVRIAALQSTATPALQTAPGRATELGKR